MSERRKHERWDGNILIDLEDPSGLIFEAVGLNLSSGGLCLIFPDAPAPCVAAEYNISFQLPTLTAKVENVIEIRWVDTIRTKLCGAAFIHGLRAIEVYTLQELLALERG